MDDRDFLSSSHETFQFNPVQIIKIFTGMIGVVLVIIGAFYVIKLFGEIAGALKNPDSIDPLIDGWAKAIGTENFSLTIAGKTYCLARSLAISVLCFGTGLLCWLALGIISVGGKIISWTLCDQEAIKRILTHTFGPTRKTTPAEQKNLTNPS